MIKRHDKAAFLLAEHLLDGGPGGEVASLGLADGGYDYLTRGDAMTTEMIGTIERLKTDVAQGRIVVPVRPDGPVLVLDDDANEITEPPYVEGEPGIDSP